MFDIVDNISCIFLVFFLVFRLYIYGIGIIKHQIKFV